MASAAAFAASTSRAVPGSPVTTVFYPSFPGGIALFVANSDGEVFATAGRPDKGTWREWKTVAQGKTTPGAPVTAILDLTEVPITLFVADPNGGIYTISGNPEEGFGGWSHVNPASGPDFRAAPGSPVTAYTSGLFTAFATRSDGFVSFTGRTGDGAWGKWLEIPGITILPRTPIAVAAPSALLRSLFVTDLNGRVYTSAGASPANWDWLQQGTTVPGSRVTAFYEGGFSITVFVTGSDGQVYFTRATNFEF